MAGINRIGGQRKRPKKITGDQAKLKALKELDKTNKELDKRSKVSGKLFEKRDKLMGQLGVDL